MGIERPRDAPDLLPPRAEGGAARRPALRGRPAPHVVGRVGRRAGSGSTSAPTSRWRTPWRARSSSPGLANHAFIERRDHRLRGVQRRRSSRGRSSAAERETGVPADADPASWRTPTPRADRAMICWTLGITEHHNAVDNVLRADQPRAAAPATWAATGSGSTAARPEQRAGRRRHGRASRTSCPGFQDVERRPSVRAQFERAWGRDDPAEERLAPHRDVRGHGARRAAPRSTSSARTRRSRRPTSNARRAPARGLDVLVVQDIFLHEDGRAGRRGPAARPWRAASRRAPSPTASGACSACRKVPRDRRATRATTSGSCCELVAAPRLRHGHADARGGRGTSCDRSARCTAG